MTRYPTGDTTQPNAGHHPSCNALGGFDCTCDAWSDIDDARLMREALVEIAKDDDLAVASGGARGIQAYERHRDIARYVLRHIDDGLTIDHFPGPSVNLITPEENRRRGDRA